MNCRHCAAPLQHRFLDLGFAPPSNAYLSPADLSQPELTFPLRVKVCDRCWLVQTEDFAAADALFTHDYAYFSSTSSSWVAHAALYCRQMIQDLGLDASSLVIEVASNDGYLLQHMRSAGIPCLGIEPTASTAAAAEALGIPVLREFFGEALAQGLAAEGRQADLILGNNVYAHVPDINDFTRGLAVALKPGGTITLEFPHLLQLITQGQFDTIYHEHFSYLSLLAVQSIFLAAGLRVYRVEQLSTHGGSLRLFGCHHDDPRPDEASIAALLQAERDAGLDQLATYHAFQARAEAIRNDLLLFLIEQQRAGRRVVGYGAAAKGNTLLNFAGVRPDLLSLVADGAAAKQGNYLPGSHIPIVPPEGLWRDGSPDVVLILPWNLRAEITPLIRELHRRLAPADAPQPRIYTAVPQLQEQDGL
ncbi:MAG: class I SAM-dependent methyltransferase [Synechococcaceae cyanobacterium ELA739]